YGLFGIYIYMVVFRKELIDQASSQIIVVIFVIGLVMTFVQSNINVFGHIFGFIGGMAIAPLVLANVDPYSHLRPRRRKQKDRKSTRLNSSHVSISYAVLCFKKTT